MERCLSRIYFSMPLINLFDRFCENRSSSYFNSSVLVARFKDCMDWTCSMLFFNFFTCFLNAVPSGKHKKFYLISLYIVLDIFFFTCEILKLSILSNDNAYIFSAALLMSYCNFSFLILSSVVMQTFCKIISQTWLRVHTINEFYFTFYGLPMFLLFNWQWGSFVFLSVFSKTLELPFEITASCLIIKW